MITLFLPYDDKILEQNYYDNFKEYTDYRLLKVLKKKKSYFFFQTFNLKELKKFRKDQVGFPPIESIGKTLSLVNRKELLTKPQFTITIIIIN